MAVAPPPQTPLPRAYVLLSGLAMGAADVVPGVSGGSMAFILGIYSNCSLRGAGRRQRHGCILVSCCPADGDFWLGAPAGATDHLAL